MVEHWSPKPGAVGSIPTTRAEKVKIQMSEIKKYVLESFDELRNKVSWPTWKELQSSSILVLIASFIIAIMIYLMDLGFGQLMKAVYKTL